MTEDEFDYKSVKKCRSIIQEILNYGVSQYEIKKLIHLLSLELEDIDLMKEITSLLNKEKIEQEKSEQEKTKSKQKLIL